MSDPKNITSKALALIRENWGWVAAVVGVVLWGHSQYIMDLSTREAVEQLPADIQQMVTCHRHFGSGGVYFLPCAVSDVGSHSDLHANGVTDTGRYTQ